MEGGGEGGGEGEVTHCAVLDYYSLMGDKQSL